MASSFSFMTLGLFMENDNYLGSSFLLGSEFTTSVLQLFSALPPMWGANTSPAWRFSQDDSGGSRRKKSAKLGSEVPGDWQHKSILIKLYRDLNSVMESLTLKTLFVNSLAWLVWAFHLFIWGRKNWDLLWPSEMDEPSKTKNSVVPTRRMTSEGGVGVKAKEFWGLSLGWRQAGVSRSREKWGAW